MKAKKALVQQSVFPKPPTSLVQTPVTSSKLAHTKITKAIIAQALVTQARTKVSGPDKINFQILHMIWGWDKTWITSMVYHTIRLGYYPTEWKNA